MSSKCLYCNQFVSKDKKFCNKEHKLKYKNRLENDLDRVSPSTKSRGYNDNESKLIEKFMNLKFKTKKE